VTATKQGGERELERLPLAEDHLLGLAADRLVVNF
jgi:hypothetical protein